MDEAVDLFSKEHAINLMIANIQRALAVVSYPQGRFENKAPAKCSKPTHLF